jgi:hypothetical protein
MKAVPEVEWEFDFLALFVELDRAANVIDYHLAGIAARHMLFEFLADGRVYCPVHIFV